MPPPCAWLADAHGIGLTLHRITVERALAAVQAVNNAVEEMQHNGGLREINRAFKALLASGCRGDLVADRYLPILHRRTRLDSNSIF